MVRPFTGSEGLISPHYDGRLTINRQTGEALYSTVAFYPVSDRKREITVKGTCATGTNPAANLPKPKL